MCLCVCVCVYVCVCVCVGGGGASDNHNVNNVKIHTYIMASRLRSIHLNTSWHLDDLTVLFVQAVNDSRILTYIVENFLNLRNTNPKTSTVNIHAFYQMKSPSEKRENNFINIGT